MRWTESIIVDRPISQVAAAIADENELMRWSAWPEATGYTCSVDGDGTSIGSCIVFRDRNGVEQGRQRLNAVTAHRIEYRLTNRGPGGRTMTPEVDFRFEPLGTDRTQVSLDFHVEVPLPALLRRIAEPVIARRVRALHVKDLEQLKQYVETTPAAA
jgi:Polyketide cyclase / dehydrase and lipid transport